MSEIHGELDFETWSAAGYVWGDDGKFHAPKGAKDKGLRTVGAAAYAEHPSTEVLTLSYSLPAVPCRDCGSLPRDPYADRGGPCYTCGGATPRPVLRRWQPGKPLPTDLFDYLATGGALQAHNVMFERLIWANVCVPKYGFPPLEPYQYQLRCSMAKARVASLPGGLGDLSAVLCLPTPKDADGKRLLNKFSMPRNPTKSDPRWRIRPTDPGEEDDAEKLYRYCDTDIIAEQGASERTPPMSAAEHMFWLIDQEINWRGVAIDRQGVEDCMAVLEQALEQYGEEYRQITGLNPTQLQASAGWLAAHGVYMATMDAERIEEALKNKHITGAQRRVLEIRQLIGSASVKKLYAMANQACRDDRLRNLIMHHGARTGRPTGEGPQPLNMPRSGPDLRWCGKSDKGKWLDVGCRRPFKPSHTACPWCAHPLTHTNPLEWNAEAVDHVLGTMATRNLAVIEWYFGDALSCISGCIRGLFVAAPGHDLIASDYSAIEAVVTAMLAGEQWRIEAFRRGDPIYLVSAAKITGKTLQFYLDFKADTGAHHPDRQYKGKVNELANGFGGWIGAQRAFGFDGTDDEAKENVLAWRAASPAIVEMWGGQTRREGWGQARPERYGFEGAAVNAIEYPGQVYTSNGIQFFVRSWRKGDAFTAEDGDASNIFNGDALIIRLLSGRELTYWSPQLVRPHQEWAKAWEHAIQYMTWNSNPKYGMLGWGPMNTYGGRLTENIVQATAHDVLRDAIINLRAAGYPTVLHVYDEIVVEVPTGCGSLEHVEQIMSTMPAWCADWPISASGGWRGRRYRKG